jgi:hypothetical protein
MFRWVIVLLVLLVQAAKKETDCTKFIDKSDRVLVPFEQEGLIMFYRFLCDFVNIRYGGFLHEEAAKKGKHMGITLDGAGPVMVDLQIFPVPGEQNIKLVQMVAHEKKVPIDSASREVVKFPSQLYKSWF